MLELMIATSVIVGQFDLTHNYVQTDLLTQTGEIVTIVHYDEMMTMTEEMGGC